MSWSASAMGKAEAVAKSIHSQLDQYSAMAEPEQTIKDKIVECVDKIASVWPDVGVTVSASGSQYAYQSGNEPVRGLNLNVTITAIKFAE